MFKRCGQILTTGNQVGTWDSGNHSSDLSMKTQGILQAEMEIMGMPAAEYYPYFSFNFSFKF